jgi:hypothetical protein
MKYTHIIERIVLLDSIHRLEVSGSVVSNWPLCEFWTCVLWFFWYTYFIPQFFETPDEDNVQKYNSFNTNTPLSESYRNYSTGALQSQRESESVMNMTLPSLLLHHFIPMLSVQFRIATAYCLLFTPTAHSAHPPIRMLDLTSGTHLTLRTLSTPTQPHMMDLISETGCTRF